MLSIGTRKLSIFASNTTPSARHADRLMTACTRLDRPTCGRRLAGLEQARPSDLCAPATSMTTGPWTSRRWPSSHGDEALDFVFGENSLRWLLCAFAHLPHRGAERVEQFVCEAAVDGVGAVGAIELADLANHAPELCAVVPQLLAIRQLSKPYAFST